MRNILLNFLKGIGCIGVIFIHAPFPGEFGRAVSKLAQFAVPMFFMISGFFAYSNSVDKLTEKAMKILRIVLYAIGFYFIFSIVVHFYKHSLVNFAYDLINIKNLARMLFLQDCSLIKGVHLWFLPALLFCYLFQIKIEKSSKQKNIYILILLLLIVDLIVSFCSDSKFCGWQIKCNFFCTGLFWFLLGKYMADRKEAIVTFLSNKTICALVFFTAMLAIYLNLFKLNFSETAVVFYSTLLFILAIKNPAVHLNSFIEFVGEKLSLNVYIFHIILIGIMDKLFIRYALDKNTVFLSLKPIIVVIASLALSCLIYKIKNIKRNNSCK